MDKETKYERPNTVSGLLAKHKELSILRDKHAAKVKQIAADMAHIEAAVCIFDPQASVYEMKDAVARPRAKNGAVKRHVLDLFREATEPLTSRHVALAWIEKNDLGGADAAYLEVRKKMTACMKVCIKQGLLEECGWTTDHDTYGPYKLWQLKEGHA